MKILNPLNYHERVKVYEISELPHMTVPDQTMSLRTILDRYARGLPVTGNDLEPKYYDEEFPNVATLDLVDIEDMKLQNSQFIKETQEKLKLRQQQLAAEKAAKTTKILLKDDINQTTQVVKNTDKNQSQTQMPDKEAT